MVMGRRQAHRLRQGFAVDRPGALASCKSGLASNHRHRETLRRTISPLVRAHYLTSVRRWRRRSEGAAWDLRPTPASSIQIDARIHPVCSRAAQAVRDRLRVPVASARHTSDNRRSQKPLAPPRCRLQRRHSRLNSVEASTRTPRCGTRDAEKQNSGEGIRFGRSVSIEIEACVAQ
jgi:hypothetical protein